MGWVVTSERDLNRVEVLAQVGRRRSTLYREIKRNCFEDTELPYSSGYYGMSARRSASDRRARRRKLVRLDGLREHVIDQLEIGWTPEQIAHRMIHDEVHPRVRQKTIYRYVSEKDGQRQDL